MGAGPAICRSEPVDVLEPAVHGVGPSVLELELELELEQLRAPAGSERYAVHAEAGVFRANIGTCKSSIAPCTRSRNRISIGNYTLVSRIQSKTGPEQLT